MKKKSVKGGTITAKSSSVSEGEFEDINLNDGSEPSKSKEEKPWKPFATFLGSLKDSVGIVKTIR